MKTFSDESSKSLKFNANWDFSDLALVLITIGVISIGVSFAAKPLKNLLAIVVNQQALAIYFFVIITLIQAVVVSLVVLGLVRASHSQLASLGLRYTGWKSILLGVVTGLGLLLLGLAADRIILGLWPQVQPQPISKAIGNASSGWQLGSLVVVGSVLAPFSEEIVYRGFSLPLFRGFKKGTLALWLNGLFFALMHFDLYRLLPLALAGFILNWLYVKTNSLYPAIIAHSVWNGIMTLLVFFHLTL